MNEEFRDPSTGTSWNNRASAALGNEISRMIWEGVAKPWKPPSTKPTSQPKPSFVPSAGVPATRASAKPAQSLVYHHGGRYPPSSEAKSTQVATPEGSP